MTVSFLIASANLPSFNAILGASKTLDPVQLSGAGWTGAPWPKGLFAKIVDAATTPARVELTPSLERAGVHGAFIAFTRGAARGVVIARTAEGASFHVPILASPADYLLAAGLAAGAAQLLGTTVSVVDAGEPTATAPDALLAKWTVDSADAHARQFGAWLADDIAAGRTYFFHGPRGVVSVGPGDLLDVAVALLFDRAQSLLVGAAPATVTDARREAVLLTAAMVFAAGADGVLAEEEARQLEAHFATVRELRAFSAKDLMAAVRTEVDGMDALAALGPALRRKAFVLAAEVIASARDGKLGGSEDDPNVQAVSALAKALHLEDDQLFLAQVVRTVNAKYEDAKVADSSLAKSLVLAMLLVAAADGVVDDKETAVLSALARTVPDLKLHDVIGLLDAAKGHTLDELATDQPDKCFALATEVALVTGLTHEETLLPRVRAKLAPDADYADAAIATFAAKYA